MRMILAILSLPFFVLGFIYSFVKQGCKDGTALEEKLRDFIIRSDE